jgi:hypothetical protein
MLAFCSTSSIEVPRSRLIRTMISKDLLRQARRQPEARLVEQDQLGRRHDRARDREHLLLSARQQAGVLRGTLPQDREIPEHRLHVAGDLVAVLAGVGAHQQVVVHRQQGEHLAALGHVRQAALHDQGRVHGR